MTATQHPPPNPVLRFLTAMAGWVQLWRGAILTAIALTLAGFHATLFSVVALLGVIWVPILALVLWGRMLDETMHMRSDLEDDPW